MFSAICFILDQSKILSSGNGLTGNFILTKLPAYAAFKIFRCCPKLVSRVYEDILASLNLYS